ncbi:MAG TPA: type II secretion system F family protein [Gemmatimonadales bacterium]|nr:type II secretion system F family protein [Gemmatimonadales bacterium]
MIAALPRSVWIPAAAAFAAVTLGTLSLILVWEWWRGRRREQQVSEQLQALASDPTRDADDLGLLRTGPAEAPWLMALAGRVPQLGDIQLLLQQGAVEWSVQTYLIVTAGFAFGLGITVFLLSASWAFAIAAVIGGGFLPYFYARYKRSQRLSAFEELLPDTTDLIGRALRAGHPLNAGLKMAADEGSEPVAGELRRIYEEQRFGLPMDESLMALADRIDLIDVRILVTAIMIQREVGGNLAEILDNLAQVMRARFTIRRQVKVYTAQGRMTGYLVGSLPIIMGFLLQFLNPGYETVLFTDSLGKLLLGFGAGLQIVGFLWIRKIVNIEI